MIKVGTLCWLRYAYYPHWVGRVVQVSGEVIRNAPIFSLSGGSCVIADAYPVTAEWLPVSHGKLGWLCGLNQLIPFSDPLPDPIVTPVAEPKEQTA